MSGSGFAAQFQHQHERQIVSKPIAKTSSEDMFRKSMEMTIKELASKLEATQELYIKFCGKRFEIDSDESASVVSHASRKTFTHVSHQMAESLASGPQTPMTSTSPMSPSTSPGMPPASTFFYQQDPQQQAMQQAMQQFQQQAMQQFQQQAMQQFQQQQQQQAQAQAPAFQPMQQQQQAQAPAFQPIQQQQPQLAAEAAPFPYPAAAAAAPKPAPKPYAAAASQAPKPAPKPTPAPKPSAAAMEAAIVDGTYARGGGGGGGGGGAPAPQAAVMGKGKGLSKEEREAAKSKRQIELAREQLLSCPEAQAWIDKIAAFLNESNECKKLADLGQSSNGLAKPAACAALKLKDALMSDERFIVKGDEVRLSEWSEGEAEAEAEAEWGDQAEGGATGDLSEGADVAQEDEEEAQEEEASRTVYSGRIYFKADTFAFISFPAEKDEAHQALFTGMCDWLKAQKEKGKKKPSVIAFKMIGSEKFGQNLIAYKNESNADVFDSLKQLDKIVYYINEKVDNDGDTCFYAVDIIPAE